MTPSEFTLLISESYHAESLNSFKHTLNFSKIKIKLDFEGISSLYQFIYKQNQGWQKWLTDRPSLENNDEFKTSINFFKNLETGFLNYTKGDLGNLISYAKNSIQNSDKILTYDCPETVFLIDIATNFPNSLQTAYQYFVESIRASDLSRDSFIGYLWAYEFDTKGKSEITKRKKAEKTSIAFQQEATNKYYNDAETLLVQQISNTEKKYQDFTRGIEDFQSQKEKLYNDWFSSTSDTFGTFNTDSNTKIKALEDLYSEKLKLEEPAKYWETRAKKMNERGWDFAHCLIALVVCTGIFLGFLLWHLPDTIFLSFLGDDKSAAVRWSIIFITFISFIAYAVKALTKAMFSAFHLASDCNERHTLTYFYLSLKKDTTIDKEEKQLIMQSLFSRADTGLLKDDSSPSMPGLIEKIVSK
ncbi:hypothetical protein DSL64_21475 [Dyadobacter luteus]|uniref:DUF6161 domain-containing protein n=1 Tax=Dyadobacter luteus TaxID=2259619 RepID=A0A3D8Y7F5_9BACT|nr:DUF6161 domain-containing protein [Dyadobacter luteus]REA58181.1 hypothetical protein DSL64_21475 [Dyadobacter luteus]